MNNAACTNCLGGMGKYSCPCFHANSAARAGLPAHATQSRECDGECEVVDRRQFLCGAARLVTAASLSIGCGLLVLRRSAAKDCVRVLPCDDCHRFTSCELPKAQTARQRIARTDSTRQNEGGLRA